MPDPQIALTAAFSAAIEGAFGEQWAGTDPAVRLAANPQFGDYQVNAAMALAKLLDRNPREVALAIVGALGPSAMCAAVDVAGPGFVNVTLADDWLADQVAAVVSDSRAGVRVAAVPEIVVVDYSSPNLAKEMHVGHLRSTVIGDALVRVLEFAGHRVIRQNHVGDWGTQFGMLVEHLASEGWSVDEGERHISDLNSLYQSANGRFVRDQEFADRARRRVVALQAGDIETVALWRDLVAESERHFEAVYGRLGVLLRLDDVRGESFYNDRLAALVDELETSGLAVVDDGALCVFPAGFNGRDGEPLPLIVRKSDGGFGYAATDLAAIRYRLRDLGADRVVYVVDARQSQHFAMVFGVAAMAGWMKTGGRAEHVAFGTILGSDGKPFKTRSGDTPKLADLLAEAVARAADVVAAKSPDLSADESAAVAVAVGIGAVKYADLCADRIKDYVFDWDRMLSFDGNTAAYLQNSYVRIKSIFRRAEGSGAGPVVPVTSVVSVWPVGPVTLAEPQERALGLALLQFDGVVFAVAESLAPHRLCTYLFDLAQTFTAFYEACPVLRAPSSEIRESRLALCEATANVLATGLGLLGIDTVERM